MSFPYKTRTIWLYVPQNTGEQLLLFSQENALDRPAGICFKGYLEYLRNLHDRGRLLPCDYGWGHKISDDALECLQLFNNLE